MTWPAGIGIALLIAAAVMVVLSQHGIGTRNTTPHTPPPDGDPTS